MEDSWNGKAAVISPLNGEPVFAELAVRELAEASNGWSSRWVEAYGAPHLRPHLLRSWPGQRGLVDAYSPIEDERVVALVAAIADENGKKHSGVWDVVAWHEESGRIVFYESKRLKRDALRGSQFAWADAAIRAGLPSDALVVVEWSFEDDLPAEGQHAS